MHSRDNNSIMFHTQDGRISRQGDMNDDGNWFFINMHDSVVLKDGRPIGYRTCQGRTSFVSFTGGTINVNDIKPMNQSDIKTYLPEFADYLLECYHA